MKDFLLYLVKKLVDHPENITIDQEETDHQMLLSLKVDKEDMGKIIGKEGKIIYAIRNLLKVRGTKEGYSVRIELIEAK